ncbi:MAG: AraC family transcriptional regulator [Anaerolineaceae bacterium]|nr:AraC family transcriptional regulator [Anaerolineaceae bacterium]
MGQNISIHISDRSHYNLTLNVYNCGCQDIERERLERPDHYILYYINKGKGSINIRHVSYKVEAGQGFVVFPGVESMIQSHYKDTMNVTWIAFSGYLVDRYLSRANLSVYDPVFYDNEKHEAGAMFDSMLNAAQHFPNRYCKIMAQLYSIIAFLIDNAIPESKIGTTTPEFYLMRALDFIDRNYFENISISDIASSVGVSRKTLSTVFSTLTGFSPKDYLIYYRISKAVDLLRDRNLTVEMIATSIGYNEQFYFCKQFKQNVGMTPSACRKTMAENPDWRFESPIDHVRQKYSEPSTNDKPPEF